MDTAAPSSVPKDPLDSPVWDATVENYLKGHPIVFDDDVVVGLPPVTEDQTHVPIMVDARKLGQVDEMVIIGDLSPFPLTLKVRPNGSPAFVAFRMRIEQATVIRAAVMKDGTWHVGGRYLDASGGGCEAPPADEAKLDWSTLGRMRGKIWRETADTLRLRLRIVHPMDTGLEKEPAFYIETMKITDANGKMLCDLDVRQPISDYPTFTFLLADPKTGDHVAIAARDTDGNDFSAKVPLPHLAEAEPVIREGRL